VEGSIVLGASLASVMIRGGFSPFLAAGAAFFAGLTAGLMTGLMQTKLKIPALLSGILSMIALYSINIRVMLGTANVSLLRQPTIFSNMMEMGLSKNISTILVGLICAACVVAVTCWFLGTEIGCAVRATGNSPQMAKAQGINTDRAKLIGLSLSNGLVGFSGGLIAQYLGFSDVQMGVGSIVIGLASLIIGEVLFARRGGLARALISLVLGSVIYRIIIALVFEAGMPSTDLKLFTAITVAAALYLPTLKEHIGHAFLKKEAAK
jgi:putative ABC transport system permease protein